MKILAGIEIPAQEAERRAECCCTERAHERLAVHPRGNREEGRGHSRDSRAEAVHMVQDAERRGDSDDPDDCKPYIENSAQIAAKKVREKLRPNSGRHQEQRRGGHPDKKLHLMMEQAAIVQEADSRQKRGTGQDAENLGERNVVQRKQHGQDKPEVDRDAAQQGNRADVNFPRPRLIHHSESEREVPNRDGEPQRRQQGNRESDQVSRDRK